MISRAHQVISEHALDYLLVKKSPVISLDSQAGLPNRGTCLVRLGPRARRPATDSSFWGRAGLPKTGHSPFKGFSLKLVNF